MAGGFWVDIKFGFWVVLARLTGNSFARSVGLCAKQGRAPLPGSGEERTKLCDVTRGVIGETRFGKAMISNL